jgi:dynein heavy chain, axonemal
MIVFDGAVSSIDSAAQSIHNSCEFVQVLFDGECSCDGPVEQWLNSVVDAMKQALCAEYAKAIPAYDNMKRSTEWIYEFSAQNTIVVSRTFFTQEVNEAFEELEDGNEDALKVLFSPTKLVRPST